MGGGGQNSGSVHCPSQAEKKSKIILLLQSTDLLLPHSLERLQFWVGANVDVDGDVDDDDSNDNGSNDNGNNDNDNDSNDNDNSAINKT